MEAEVKKEEDYVECRSIIDMYLQWDILVDKMQEVKREIERIEQEISIMTKKMR